jgi:Vacuolar sorting protein 9 (VPS9) domain
MFKIPETKLSPSGWRSVSTILNVGVGMSTLPCAKLRAILDAAKEIIRVYSEEHKTSEEKQTPEEQATNDENENDILRKSDLGADDFLPIFIYSVVRAEMERPCALCKW